MLKVNDLVKDEIFSHRFSMLLGGNSESMSIIPVNEKYRDLIRLIMALHYKECQEPRVQKILLETFYIDDFTNIKKKLEELFFLLTNRNVELIFRSKKLTGTQTLFEEPKLKDPILFSGGVDSISGAIKYISNNSKYVLIHVNSSKQIFGKVKKILADKLFNTTKTFCINSRIKSERYRSFISNTRGLLYLTVGYVFSKILKSNKLIFCENGAQMLDIMLEGIAYKNAIATKNTNLRYLKLIEEMLLSFEDNKFFVDYPFKNYTKSELISTYIHPDLVQKSWSCYSARGRRMMCGSCWNCFITKMSALAAGIPLRNLYFKTNPLIETLDSPFYLDNQRILYNMMVFYEKVINKDNKVIEELGRYEKFFNNPVDLATRFGLDLFLGLSIDLSRTRSKNGLGKKAEELLCRIDPSILKDREQQIASLKVNNGLFNH